MEAQQRKRDGQKMTEALEPSTAASSVLSCGPRPSRNTVP